MINNCSDCKHRSLTFQWRYIKLLQWRCTAPDYTTDGGTGGRKNHMSCSFVRNHQMNYCTKWEKQ